MSQISRKMKKSILVPIAIVIFIAGIADIKYRGLFFQLLPKSIQSFFVRIFT